MNCRSLMLLGCCSVALFVGCGVDTPKPAQVTGNVTLDGKPMPGGEVRFCVVGEPVKSLEVKDGVFSGEVFVGENVVEVVWDVDGPPHPMEPTKKIKVNSVDAKFSGPNSPFREQISEAGASDLQFSVTSAKK